MLQSKQLVSKNRHIENYGYQGALGILAGEGSLPYIAARSAIASGENVKIFYFTKEEPPADLRDISFRVQLLRMFSDIIPSMKREGVKRLILLGKARRDILYGSSLFRFDWRVFFLLARSINQNDYTIFETFSKEFQKKGITIIDQDTYLKNFYLSIGRYGKRLTSRELSDIEYGMFYAREINRLDIGQTVVIGKRNVLAVEGVEGTDRCILRGGELFHKKGAVVCKVAKRKHDKRFDIPTTGFSTLESMAKSGCRVLAIEAEKTLVISPKEFIERAKKLGITIIAVQPEKSSLKELKRINIRQKKYHKNTH